MDRAIERFGYNPRDFHVQAITSDLLIEEKELYPDEIGLKKRPALKPHYPQGARSWAHPPHKSRYIDACLERRLLRAQYSRGDPRRGHDNSG